MLELLDKSGVADLLLMSHRKVEYLVGRGEIPYLKIGKQIRFSRDAVENWVKGFDKSKPEADEANNDTEEK